MIKTLNLHWSLMLLVNYFKVGLPPPKKYSFICFNDSCLKMIKYAFYFTLKALFILKIFCNISRIKAKHIMKFGLLIEYNEKHFSSKIREAGRLVPASLLFLKKLHMRQKQVVYGLVSICLHSTQLGIQ